MAATVSFACPKCQAQLRGPAGLRGKKARCKKCGHTFVVGAPSGKSAAPAPAAPRKSGPAPAPSNPADDDGPAMYSWLPEDANAQINQAQQMAPLKSDLQPKYEGVERNPYGLTKLDETPRCPFCAKEMEADAIVCLHCGYNTQTRSVAKTKRTYAVTPAEQFMWLLPGILCAAAVFALIGGIVYLWTGLPDPHSKDLRESTWSEFIRPAQLWGTILAGFLIAGSGMFAIRRLFLHPKPPEKEKK
jgi:hypothetical protein